MCWYKISIFTNSETKFNTLLWTINFYLKKKTNPIVIVYKLQIWDAYINKLKFRVCKSLRLQEKIWMSFYFYQRERVNLFIELSQRSVKHLIKII